MNTISKIVFLNASALNSAWVLMNSATDVWPDGLGSSSGELGHNIMDHHLDVGASGDVEGYEDKYYYGRRPMVFIFRVTEIYLVIKEIICVALVTRVVPAGRAGAGKLQK